MSLQGDIARELPGLRAAAESLMSLTLAAYSPSGTTTDTDGYQVPAFATEAETSGKVQSGSQAGQDTATRYVSIGGVDRPVLAGGLHIPLAAYVDPILSTLSIVASEQRGVGWEFEVVAVGDADPALLGRRYLVVGLPVKSYATARRLDVVEV